MLLWRLASRGLGKSGFSNNVSPTLTYHECEILPLSQDYSADTLPWQGDQSS